MSLYYNCSECNSRACLKGGEYPDGCPGVLGEQLVDSATNFVVDDEESRRIMASSISAAHKENGKRNNRLETLIKFCNSMGYKNIGVAFCVSLSKEARVLCSRLLSESFSVIPVCCKVGGKTSSDMGVEPNNGNCVSCNPVAQAYLLNACNTDINIALGLCLGHDILFSMHSKSPTTTFIVKDNTLKHNTVLALQDTE